MSTSQQDFNQAIASTLIRNPLIPIISNVTATPMLASDEIKSDLQNQLTHRVRWSESIQYMISEGISTFIEIGNGSVLSGLVKRIDRAVIASPLGSPADFQNLA
jgi:[acyl-carrier-protein] S-malonyltransferase